MQGALVPQHTVKPSLVGSFPQARVKPSLEQNPVTVTSGGGSVVSGSPAAQTFTFNRFWPAYYASYYPYGYSYPSYFTGYGYGGYGGYPGVCPPGTALSWDGACRPSYYGGYGGYGSPYLSLYGFNPLAGYQFSYAPWMFGGWGRRFF